MAAKKMPPAPIDRPLSRAYLREFSGWSTASPPGLSEPTSLRAMENVYITMDGAAAVRPGLRSIFTPDFWLDSNYNADAVGSFETFFLNDGTKALLFAVREHSSADRVSFRVAVYDELAERYAVYPIDDATYGFSVPGGVASLAFTSATTYVTYVQIDNKVFALSDAGESMRMFWVGTEKKAKTLTSIEEPDYVAADKLTVVHPVASWISGPQTSVPTAETPAAGTLISSTSTLNMYNFAYFYTFNNEIGESAPSMLTVVKTQRRLSGWQVDPSNDAASADQLVASIPVAVWAAAVAAGATSWNLYMLTWSNQDSVPVEGLLLKTTSMTGSATHATHGWAAHTPLVEGLEVTMGLPNATNRYNSTAPSKAGQGIVAGDRMVLVNDRSAAAVIRWSSNLQGDYTNFSPAKGGGYKTLTSGNLFIPAAVKLWQNPQSVDTLTVLCMGVDGYSTSYYMNPGSAINGGSQATVIMGFEETTATPGTVSPYGCEVLNNALYHPLDWALVKSTASNYNINHKTMTDPIQNKWLELLNKQRIVSSQFENRLYFIVHNPDGAELEDGCNGNEIWICDTGAETATWSRWLIQAVSLRKLDIGDKLYMAVVRPEGIYFLDELSGMDEYNDGGVTAERAIPWYLETNTQGANRAHDAWAHVRQMDLTVGNFLGSMEWGLIGWNRHGKAVHKHKTFRDLDVVDMHDRPLPWDQQDLLDISEEMKEWRFYARSVDNDTPSYGRINFVQYRYVPISVNVGYQYGSTETEEYERARVNWNQRTTDNGIPQPFIETRRP